MAPFSSIRQQLGMGMLPMPHVKDGHAVRQVIIGKSPLFQGVKPWNIFRTEMLIPARLMWSL
ncbi:MAG TPA: hypothetical protein PLP19_14040 [bacterium]|nr:hypothetical protein [bacterium]HPN44609.1 hypothetical protein [bacterium]